MKRILSIATLLFSASVFAFNLPWAYFSPAQGRQAFEEMFGLIGNAKNYAYVTVYSWSAQGFDKALFEARSRGVDTRVVLHRPLCRKASLRERIQKLQQAGVQFKCAKQNMHEKFVLVDGEYFVNSSANMSFGAMTRYSETFVFHRLNHFKDQMTELYQDFLHEFSILWNSGTDHGVRTRPLKSYHPNAERGNFVVNLPVASRDTYLVSSSMNFKSNIVTASRVQDGRFLRMRKVNYPNSDVQTKLVEEQIVREIDLAVQSIFLNLNHFCSTGILEAVKRAVLRGVDVRFVVDNQEYKYGSRGGHGIEMTPVFASWWKGQFRKPVPVRVKFYSLAPAPRYWRLNHNKSILIDYKTSKPVLIAGSYNLSTNAEYNQFDNMVLYRGQNYDRLHDQFYGEFQSMWNSNRDFTNIQESGVWSYFADAIAKKSIPLHMDRDVSLGWDEMNVLYNFINRATTKKVSGRNRSIFSAISFQTRECRSYNVNTGRMSGCPSR